MNPDDFDPAEADRQAFEAIVGQPDLADLGKDVSAYPVLQLRIPLDVAISVADAAEHVENHECVNAFIYLGKFVGVLLARITTAVDTADADWLALPPVDINLETAAELYEEIHDDGSATFDTEVARLKDLLDRLAELEDEEGDDA